MGEAKRRKKLDPTFGKKPKESINKNINPEADMESNFDYKFPSGFSIRIIDGDPQPEADVLNEVDFMLDSPYLLMTFEEFLAAVRESCFDPEDRPIESRPVFAAIWKNAAEIMTGDPTALPTCNQVSEVKDLPKIVGSFSKAVQCMAKLRGLHPLTETCFNSCFWDVMSWAIQVDEDAPVSKVQAMTMAKNWDWLRSQS